jgi:hypothetical protein
MILVEATSGVVGNLWSHEYGPGKKNIREAAAEHGVLDKAQSSFTRT